MHKTWAIAAAVLSMAAPSLVAGGRGPTIAVLPLAAADSGIPYGLLPSPSELNVMTAQLRAGLGADAVSLVVQKRLAPAVAAAGFDQTSPIRSCVVAECARTIGRVVHADEVVVGAVTREMAVIWGTSFSIVDVRSGKVIGEMNVGYKGDVQAMELGERDAGGCLARMIKGQKPCPPDRGW
ncbi:MAG: hypothetical protein ACLPYS_05725 [Vulcanimicrobiaceae bacterium]